MKKVAIWVVTGALFIIPFLPLYVANSQFFPFITGKGFAFRLLIEAALAGWLVLMLADKAYRPKFSWLLVIYAALIVWMFIANLLGMNPHKAFWSNYERMDGWITIVHVFGLFLVAGSFLTVQKLWQKWWMAFIIGSALTVGVALIQLWGFLPINQGGGRVDATFGNAAYLAAYLLFAIAVSFWQGLIAREKRVRYSLFVLVALQTIILFATATRGAMLGAIVGAVFGAGLFAVLSTNKKVRGGAIAALIGVLVLIGGFLMIRQTAFVQNDTTLARLASINLEEGATRFTIWNIALKGIQERPILGWGQEGFNYVFNAYYQPSMYAQEVWFDRAHDVYLDWAIAGGIPALLLFLALLGTAAWTLFRTNQLSRTERIVLLSAMAAYGFQALFVFDNLFTYVPLAAILAIAHSVSDRQMQWMQKLNEVKEDQLQLAAAPIVIVGAIALMWMVNVPGIAASRHLIEAVSPQPGMASNIPLFEKALADGSFATQEIREHLVQYAISASSNPASASVMPDIASFAIQQMNEQVAETPNDVRMRYYLALAYRVAGSSDKALEQMDAAIALSPQKQFLYLEKGTTALEAQNSKVAYESFKTAYELDTRNNVAAEYYAAGLVYMDDWNGARTFMLDRFSTTTIDNQALARSYYDKKHYDEFINVWKLRAARDSGNPATRFNLATAYMLANRIPEAIAEIRATIATYPSTAQQGAAMLRQLGASY